MTLYIVLEQVSGCHWHAVGVGIKLTYKVYVLTWRSRFCSYSNCLCCQVFSSVSRYLFKLSIFCWIYNHRHRRPSQISLTIYFDFLQPHVNKKLLGSYENTNKNCE